MRSADRSDAAWLAAPALQGLDETMQVASRGGTYMRQKLLALLLALALAMGGLTACGGGGEGGAPGGGEAEGGEEEDD